MTDFKLILQKHFLTAIIFWCSVIFCSAQTLPVKFSEKATSSDSIQTENLLNDTLKNNLSLFYIDTICLTGNRKTKYYYIERELPFKRGDSLLLQNMQPLFKRGEEWLMNTGLFNMVTISFKSLPEHKVQVLIEVKERWYIFPLPYFKPIDRNLSVWGEKKYSFRRVNYGLKLYYNNTSGRNDNLKLFLISGYNRLAEIAYEQPNADKNLKYGYGLQYSYAAYKEINAATVGNKQLFINSDTIPNAGRFLLENWSFSAAFNYRPALKTRHSVRISGFITKIDKTVLNVNPEFLINSKLKLFYPEISYSWSFQNTDYAPYPLRGTIARAGILKRGLMKNINLWELKGAINYSKPLGKGFYFSTAKFAVVKLPFKQPFFNSSLFGYGDLYLRGLEKYVIDGVVGVLSKNTFRKEILNTQFCLPFIKSISHSKFPLRIYLKSYSDVGYVHNPNIKTNQFVNQLLYSGGAGVDVISAYDFILRFEYSYNQLRQGGFYFYFQNDF